MKLRQGVYSRRNGADQLLANMSGTNRPDRYCLRKMQTLPHMRSNARTPCSRASVGKWLRCRNRRVAKEKNRSSHARTECQTHMELPLVTAKAAWNLAAWAESLLASHRANSCLAPNCKTIATIPPNKKLEISTVDLSIAHWPNGKALVPRTGALPLGCRLRAGRRHESCRPPACPPRCGSMGACADRNNCRHCPLALPQGPLMATAGAWC